MLQVNKRVKAVRKKMMKIIIHVALQDQRRKRKKRLIVILLNLLREVVAVFGMIVDLRQHFVSAYRDTVLISWTPFAFQSYVVDTDLLHVSITGYMKGQMLHRREFHHPVETVNLSSIFNYSHDRFWFHTSVANVRD